MKNTHEKPQKCRKEQKCLHNSYTATWTAIYVIGINYL